MRYFTFLILHIFGIVVSLVSNSEYYKEDAYTFYWEKGNSWMRNGSRYTLKCHLQHTGVGDFKSFANNITIKDFHGAISSTARLKRHTLTVAAEIPSFKAKNEGTYECVWRHNKKTVVIKKHVQMFTEPGKIEVLEKSPERMRLKEGEPLSLFAAFTVYPADKDNYTAQWSRVFNLTSGGGDQTEVILNNKNYRTSSKAIDNGEFSENLDIGTESVTTDKSGMYLLTISYFDTVLIVKWRVEIENEQPDIEIKVHEPPFFTMLNQEFYTIAKRLHIDCITMSIPKREIIFEIRSNRSDEITALNRAELQETHGTFESRYSWTTTVSSDTEVRCSNSVKGRTATKSILVADKPEILLKIREGDTWVTMKDSKKLYDGDDVRLECVTPNIANWTTFWRHESDKVEGGDARVDGNSKQFILTLRNANSTSSGKYTCVSRSGDTEEYMEKNITIQKTVKPFISFEQKMEMSVDYNKPFVLNCGITGIPTPDYRWFKNGKQLEYGELEGTLIKFTRARTEDNAEFECEAVNRAGNERNVFRVNVKNKPMNKWIPILIGTAIVIVVLIVILIFLLSRPSFRKKVIRNGKSLPVFNNTAHITEDQPILMSEFNASVDDCIDSLSVQIEKFLGDGQFGIVHRVYLKRRSSMLDSGSSRGVRVAIKKAKDRDSFMQQDMIAEELKIMKHIETHPNIIALLEVPGVLREPCIVLELMDRSLLDFLRKHKRASVEQEDQNETNGSYLNTASVQTIDLISFGFQISHGMQYLASLNVVHRDLAIRNVLINSNRIIRISDFGLARRPEHKDYYKAVERKEKAEPIRWMAPESINEPKIFTQKSDVWSFGICLFEIFTMGKTPYPGIDDPTGYINSGGINEQPENCPSEIYHLMECCWRMEPDDRKTFDECFHYLRDYLYEMSPEFMIRLDTTLKNEESEQKELKNWISAV